MCTTNGTNPFDTSWPSRATFTPRMSAARLPVTQ